ncbi:sensor histidine kinase, partial [Spinactinospora alkalitolerans]
MGQSGGTVRSIRSQLNRTVLIPSITFLLLFAVLSGATLLQAFSLRDAAAEGESGVGIHQVMVEVQAERRQAVQYLGDPSDRSLRLLREQTAATDEAVRAVEDALTPDSGDEAEIQDRTADLRTALNGRSGLREEVMAGEVDRPAALERYSEIVDLGFQLYDAGGRRLQDGPAVAESATALELLRAQDLFSRADALLSGAIAADELTSAQQIDFAGLVDAARRGLDANGQTLDDEVAAARSALLEGPEWREMNRIADAVAEREVTVAVDPVTGEEQTSLEPPAAVNDWREAADAVNTGLITLAGEQARAGVAVTDAAGDRALSIAIGGSILALFAGTLAYGVASKSANRLTGRLARLRQDALNLAREDLPKIVRRLERGDPINVEAEMHQLDYGDDEVGQVADAFNTAQRTAVGAAVKQAEIREGANRVFLGIAHRNQSLVQRQLQLLDRVEREEEDPDLLEDLFQLDHLATRGRRNAENLIILGGAQPGRRWRNPIPLVDILRGAISETEEYARVKLRIVPNLSLRGAVVADIIHLVAELVENATAFSPPHTKVHIHSEIVPKGVVVEIEDRGLGMSDEDYAGSNRTLSAAPEFDVMALNEDARLGLFVVARLAAKHDINVELCSSPYGGTRAIILIPAELIVSGDAPVPGPPRTAPAAAPVPRASAGPDADPDAAGDLLAPPGREPGRPNRSDVTGPIGQHARPEVPASPNGRHNGAETSPDGAG